LKNAKHRSYYCSHTTA